MLGELFRTGRTSFKGKYFNYEDVAFHSGTEMAPLRPLQMPPPIWIVSNPRLVGDKPTEKMRAIMERACDRIIRLGDGWMTCCRAEHPEELTEQIGYLKAAAERHGRDFDDYTVAYQVTMNIGDSQERGPRGLRRLHLEVLPGALAGDGPLQLGAGRHPRRHRRLDPRVPATAACATSSAASARSTSSGRSSASRARCCPHSRPRR